MKVMVIVKANADTEAGVPPTTGQIEEMTTFNEALAAAGVIKTGEGLKPTSAGARIAFAGEDRSVTRGPFPLQNIVAGFWIWEVDSLDAAIDWAKRCPNPTGEAGELEIRPFVSLEDFGEAFTPELRAREDALREKGV